MARLSLNNTCSTCFKVHIQSTTFFDLNYMSFGWSCSCPFRENVRPMKIVLWTYTEIRFIPWSKCMYELVYSDRASSTCWELRSAGQIMNFSRGQAGRQVLRNACQRCCTREKLHYLRQSQSSEMLLNKCNDSWTILMVHRLLLASTLFVIELFVLLTPTNDGSLTSWCWGHSLLQLHHCLPPRRQWAFPSALLILAYRPLPGVRLIFRGEFHFESEWFSRQNR